MTELFVQHSLKLKQRQFGQVLCALVKYCVHCAAKNYVNVAKEKHVDAAWVLYPFRSESQKHSCFSLKRASGGTETVSNALTSIPSAKSKFLEYKIKCKS